MNKKDFLVEIDFAGLSSRIKRLSDTILYSTKDFYKAVDTDIEPNWHLVFLLLNKYSSLTLTKISEHLQLSHPAVVKIVKNMKRSGYVLTEADNSDSRKQLVTLSDKALIALPQLEKYWDACIKTMKELVEDTPSFLDSLSKIEAKVQQSSYKERTLKNLK